MGEASRRKSLDPTWGRSHISDRAGTERILIERKGVVLTIESMTKAYIISCAYGDLENPKLRFVDAAVSVANQRSTIEIASEKWRETSPGVMIICDKESYHSRTGESLNDDEHFLMSWTELRELTSDSPIGLCHEVIELAKEMVANSVIDEAIGFIFLDVPISRNESESVLSTVLFMADKKNAFESEKLEFRKQ